MSKELDYTVTGCVDNCGYVKIMEKDEPKIDVSYEYGSGAVRMWRDLDGKHHLVIVNTRPERVFLTCQPFNKLLTTEGVAAILNFVENIPKSSEEALVLS